MAIVKATYPISTIATIPTNALLKRIADEEQYRMNRKA